MLTSASRESINQSTCSRACARSCAHTREAEHSIWRWTEVAAALPVQRAPQCCRPRALICNFASWPRARARVCVLTLRSRATNNTTAKATASALQVQLGDLGADAAHTCARGPKLANSKRLTRPDCVVVARELAANCCCCYRTSGKAGVTAARFHFSLRRALKALLWPHTSARAVITSRVHVGQRWRFAGGRAGGRACVRLYEAHVAASRTALE